MNLNLFRDLLTGNASDCQYVGALLVLVVILTAAGEIILAKRRNGGGGR